ncbi:MAG: Asp23/Gls24 family envelope stress response protein [Verrucomicrobia bacterium]|nr:Asp23/Gls24 family envelope stress response protein [Verrucomicrobiota bacterium]MBS0645057.1 Asp23/Gls24 family envelope stress response protein [Verrucomicrobiota bacterium]
MKDTTPMIDSRELEIPKTVFSHDIETRVIQTIILNTLNKIEGVSLIGGTLIDTLLGREVERVKGITVEQDNKNHALKVKVEVNMHYGVLIPDKSDEVQSRVVEEITRLTGFHVASVHLVIKGLVPAEQKQGDLFSSSFLAKEEDIEEQIKVT